MEKKRIQYGFQKHLSDEYPSQIVVDVTDHCNLACIHCPHEELRKSGQLSGDFLDVELHGKLIDEVAEDGQGLCQYIRYTAQGETLLHPQIFEMIKYASSHAGVLLNVTTNGTLLGEAKARALLEAGVDVVDISIDAYKSQTYKAIRRKGDLSRTRSNILKLLKVRERDGYKARIVVSFVEQSLNQGEAVDFEKFWNEMGADFVVIRRLHSAGGAKKDFVEVDKKRRPCLYPWERLSLGPDGKVHYCPQDWVRGSVIADFRDITIKEIWQGEAMAKLRQAHLKNDFSDYPFCAQCPDWITTRWPDAGRSYINLMQEVEHKKTEDEE